MRRAKKFPNSGPSRISKLVVLVYVTYLAWVGLASADATFTVDTIADGMLAAEARFTNLRLNYVTTRMSWNRRNDPIQLLEGVYAEKKTAKRLWYLDRKVSIIDPETEESTLVEDTLASFNGDATITLERKVEPDKPMRGAILAGYDPNRFPIYYMDPHTKIWYHARRLLGELLKEYRNTFRIESESEMLDGLPTVKLVGTFSDGMLTMKLWVSPQRNFLPIKRQIMQTGGRLLSETALYNLVQLPNGLWYPKTIQSPADPPGAPNPAFVTTYSISEISVDPIPQEFFSPKFPPNTQVYDDILKVSYKTY